MTNEQFAGFSAIETREVRRDKKRKKEKMAKKERTLEKKIEEALVGKGSWEGDDKGVISSRPASDRERNMIFESWKAWR
ncbi:MAG: hypothetical protein ABFC86_06120 [Rectinema sp.]